MNDAELEQLWAEWGRLQGMIQMAEVMDGQLLTEKQFDGIVLRMCYIEAIFDEEYPDEAAFDEGDE